VAFWDLARKSLVIGITSDAPLVLAAIGFALLYRLTGLINVAYSETSPWRVSRDVGQHHLRLNFYVTLIPTALLAGLFSVLTYFVIFRPAKQRKAGVVETIIISFGLSIFLRYGLQFIFGFEFRYYDVPVPKSVSLLGVGVSPSGSPRWVPPWPCPAADLVHPEVQARRSDPGPGRRREAGPGERDQPPAVTVLIWFIAGMAGGLAGAFYGVNTSCRAWLGWDQFLFILLVVIIGGAKGIGGVFIAGLATGVVISFLELVPGLNATTVYAQVIVIALFMVILKARGTGCSRREGVGAMNLDWLSQYTVTVLILIVTTGRPRAAAPPADGAGGDRQLWHRRFYGVGMYAFGMFLVHVPWPESWGCSGRS